ncbi:hypothetical protein BGZ46_008770 [Entomortierella lignicola]|nr:hypothetical protein BGZ46_008770 [Entomortierella lignicola]
MRAISAPSLVQAMASKTIQLYFYQEYVRRIGIKFEFDHFDLKRDRIVFRPQVLDLQHRFRSGLTLQNPHLEELAVFSPSNSKIPSNQVRCTEGRYYTVHSNCGTRRMPPKTPLVASSALAGLTGLEPLSEPSSEAAVNSTVEAATTAVANRTERMSQKKSQVDQRGYHGTKNFLDKSSPIQIRKDGIHELDGSKYCFLQEYPWSLQYQISYEPFGVPLSYNDKDSKKREQFFFDLRADLRSEAQARAQAQQQPETNVGNITESNNDNNNDGVIEGESALPSTSTTTTTTTTNSGSNASRYFRVLRFECSMNFLDLKRATRNIIGRWLEGKVQRWKKVLGVKRPALQHIQQQQQTESLSDSADSSSRNVSRSGKTKHSSRKVIQVIDSILGPPAKTLSSLDNDAGRQNPGSSSDSGENSDNFVHVNSTNMFFQSKPKQKQAAPAPAPAPTTTSPEPEENPKTEAIDPAKAEPAVEGDDKSKDPQEAVIEEDISPPPEPIRWFHAVDSPLTKPNEPKKNPKTPVQPRKPPTTWLPFSIRDSNALERAYQLTKPMREEEKKLEAEAAENETTTDNQKEPLRLQVPTSSSKRLSASSASLYAATSSILVNEDYLFEVNIHNMEIKPVYWLGPTYEVRRAVWFMQVDGKFVPCPDNLSQQLEIGYKKHQPWITPVATPIIDASGKEVFEEKPEKSWPLFGSFLSQYAIFTDANHAWLLSDDTASKIAKSIFTKVALNATLGGTHLIRGYDEVEKFMSKKDEDAQKKKDGADTKRKEPSEFQKKQEAIQTLKQKTKRLTEEEKDTIQESHEIEDYSNEEEAEERSIDHLILVIHGIGQKLGDRMEAINFIHDVNVMRRTMKETSATFAPHPPTNSPKDQTGSEKDKEGKNSTNPKLSGVQLLPVEWRRQITFGMANEDEEIQRDLSRPEAEESCPTMDDIMLDGVPTIRMLVSDVLMDVLLYMTPNYKRKMMEVVTEELNAVYRKFIHHNPEFLQNGGKVSIIGHSLGSLLALDILNHQPFSPDQYQPIPSSPVFEKFISFDNGSSNPVTLDFPVANFFALGSPIGLFLLLKGCKLGARLSDASVTGESAVAPCFRPAVENMFNIFHRSDPVAHRVEPLISRSFGTQMRPALIPYHKGGLKGLHLGIQDFSNDLANRANTMIESVKLGITTSVFTRALGFRTNPVSNAMLINSAKQESGGASGSTSDNEMSTIDGSDGSEGAGSTSLSRKSTVKVNNMTSKAKVKALNKTGRVDWCLQEGVFESAYLSALSVHMQYWSDSDVAAFIIRQIYDTDAK